MLITMDSDIEMELQREVKVLRKKMDKRWCKYKTNEIDLFNKQLDNLECKTLKDLV